MLADPPIPHPPRYGRACMKVPVIARAATLWVAVATPGSGHAQKRERARDLGIPLEGVPGPLDAITDVAGVEVGHRTLIAGSGKLIAGKGPVRTGVTAVFPRGKTSDDPVFAGWFTMNGNGEMTGTTWVEESGFLWGPVMITNTHSVGVVRDAVIEWALRQGRLPHDEWSLPVVAETWDGGLNDINGFRSEEHTSELQSRLHLVCRLLLEKKKKKTKIN